MCDTFLDGKWAPASLVDELANELELYGHGIQEHARCHIIQALVRKARKATGPSRKD